MKANINIDIGGTFTDCYVRSDSKEALVKTPTTTYDFSVGFMRVLKDAAEQLNVDINTLLQATDVIRYSTTIAMNKLIERKGPKLGLITTEGFEYLLFHGEGPRWADGIPHREQRDLALTEKPEPVISREMIVGVKERVDYMGKIIRPLDEEDFLGKLQYLVDNGALGFVVCLLWSFANPTHEQTIKEIIEDEYPNVYLGHMPIILSSEVHPKRGEYPRTNTAILDAYLHKSMGEDLLGIEEELRSHGYTKPIMMVHNTGGMAELFKTTAKDTYNGGPVAGIIGSAEVAKLYAAKNVMTTDMGGTSFDIGMITEGSTRSWEFRPVIDRWLVNISMLESKSIGAGGGSIAWLNEVFGNKLEVGPQSAGSMPGPACYDMGGLEPTVTDADVVLGYINPDYFHGGKMILNKEKAVEAIRDKIAKPIGIEVAEAACRIKKVVDASMGNTIYKETVLRGYDPREFILFSFGGGGPTHCCGYADRAGIPMIVTFICSPVFCAFSSSLMDIRHIYEYSSTLVFKAPMRLGGAFIDNYEQYNTVVANLQEKAIYDIVGEGLSPENVIFQLELEMKYGGQLNVKRVASPRLFLQSEDDVKEIIAAFRKEYSEAYSPLGVSEDQGVIVENFVLHAIHPLPKYDFPTFPLRGKKLGKTALKEKRSVYWEEYGDFSETKVFELSELEPGNIVDGPVVIEAPDTTFVIPGGKLFRIDEYGNGVIEGPVNIGGIF